MGGGAVQGGPAGKESACQEGRRFSAGWVGWRLSWRFKVCLKVAEGPREGTEGSAGMDWGRPIPPGSPRGQGPGPRAFSGSPGVRRRGEGRELFLG